jgi:hypothetical protein
LKFKTDKAQDLKRFQKLNLKLMTDLLGIEIAPEVVVEEMIPSVATSMETLDSGKGKKKKRKGK